MASKRMQVSFEEYYDINTAPIAFYKDCRILECFPVSDRHVLLTLQIPEPFGGTHEELVEVSTTTVEIEMEGGGN